MSIPVGTGSLPWPSGNYLNWTLPKKLREVDFDVRIKTADPQQDGFAPLFNNSRRDGDGGPPRQFNLTITNFTFFVLHIGAFPTYSTIEDEVLEVFLNPSFFWRTPCAPNIPLKLVNLKVLATPDAAARATQTAAAVVTTAAVSSSMAAGGAAAAGDAQSLALLAMMSCAQPVERQMAKNTRLLSPLAVADDLNGVLIGNFLLQAGILFVQFSALIIMKSLFKMKWLRAAEIIRFPAMSIIAAVLTHQGTGAASLQLLYDDDVCSQVRGALGAVYACALPIIQYIIIRRHVNAEYWEYDYIVSSSAAPGTGDTENAKQLEAPLVSKPPESVLHSKKAKKKDRFAGGYDTLQPLLIDPEGDESSDRDSSASKDSTSTQPAKDIAAAAPAGQTTASSSSDAKPKFSLEGTKVPPEMPAIMELGEDWEPASHRWTRMKYLLPRGRWYPVTMRKTYGPLFSSGAREGKLWGLLPTVGAVSMFAISSIRPATKEGCIAQYASMAGCQLILAVIVACFRPLRSYPANLLTALSSLCLAVVFSASATIADDPKSPRAKWFILRAVQAQLCLTMLRIGYMCLTLLIERFPLLKHPKHFMWAWKGTRVSRKVADDDDDYDTDEEEEMGALRAPGSGSPVPQIVGSLAPDSKKKFGAGSAVNRLDADLLQDLLRVADGEDKDMDDVEEYEEDEEEDDDVPQPSMLAMLGGEDDGPSFLLQRRRRAHATSPPVDATQFHGGSTAPPKPSARAEPT